MKTQFKQTLIATAVALATISSVQAIESNNAGGFYHNLFVNKDGDVYAVGNNRYFQVNTDVNKTPVYSKTGALLMYNDAYTMLPKHTGLVNVKSVAAAGNRSVALKKDGTVYFWGAVTSQDTTIKPDNYVLQQGTKKVPLDHVIDIAVGATKMLLLVEGNTTGIGTVYEYNFKDAPTVVAGLPTDSITTIAGSMEFRRVGETTTGTCITLEHFRVMDLNGNVYAWGANDKGQLGTKDYVNRTTPVKIAEGVKDIGVGPSAGFVITTNGDVYQSGWSQYLPTTTKGVNTLTKVANLFGAVKVVGNYAGAFAQVENGNVYAWGWHNYAGKGGYLRSAGAIPVVEAGVVYDIGTANQNVAMHKADGTIVSLGSNLFGQVGDNTLIERNTLPSFAQVPLGTIASVAAQLDVNFRSIPSNDPEVLAIRNCLTLNPTKTYVCEPGYVEVKQSNNPVTVTKNPDGSINVSNSNGNNGWGNGTQVAPGNSGSNNNAANNTSGKTLPNGLAGTTGATTNNGNNAAAPMVRAKMF